MDCFGILFIECVTMPMQRPSLFVPLLFLLLQGFVSRADELPELLKGVRPEPSVYLVQAGDTLASVAERLLGSSEFARELASYNRLSLPVDLSSLRTLVIPGAERNRALAAMWRANATRNAATAVGAPKFAVEEFTRAEAVSQSALRAFQAADYLQARALAQRASDEFSESIERSNANALVPREATVVTTAGELLTSIDHWVTSKPALAGERIPVRAQLRTGRESRAEIRLPDGSIFHLMALTEIGFSVIEDQRTGAIDTRLQINTGDISGNIEPRKTKGSRFLILNGPSSIVIRGTDVHTSRSEDGWLRVMTLAGDLEVLDGQGHAQSLSGGYGVYARPEKPLSKPIGLLPPPKPLYPHADVETTAQQVIEFSWKGIFSWRFKAYFVELARDPRFIDMVFSATTNERTLSSPVLADGEYYWRISSLDRHGLQGATSTPVKFVVKTDLGVVLTTDKAPFEKDGHLWLAPMTTVSAEPTAEHSSVIGYEYSVNGTAFKPFGKGVVLQTHGPYSVIVRGIGLDERRGEEARRFYQVDGTGPEILMQLGDVEEHTVKGQIQAVTLTATDLSSVSLVEYSLDGRAWRRVSGPVYRSAAMEVDLYARATDAFGNVSRRRVILEPIVESTVQPSFSPR